MNIKLNEKTALITGSTSGIGLAIATGLYKTGASIILNGRNEEKLEKIKSQPIFDNKKRVSSIAADVGTAKGCKKIFEHYPYVDILINNAGIFEPQDIFEISDDTWEKYFNINVMSGIRLSRFYIPKMIQKGWGRTIFVSSESALQIPLEMPHYGLTKTAQIAAARGFAQAAAKTGVTVNSILPGPTHSDGVNKFIRKIIPNKELTIEEAGEEFIKTVRPGSLIGRLSTAEEIANAAIFLASTQSSSITGTALRVDGGVIQSIL